MSSINNNIQELKRRKVLTSAGLYAFSSFIIMQVANIIVPALHLPDWSNSLILILLILGFPIAMIFAWLYDRTPAGFVKTDDESLDEGFTDKSTFPQNKDGQSTIVYIDIDGFTRLLDQDEKKALDLMHYKHKVFQPFIEKYHGLLIKRVGEGTLCVFADTAKAVCFCLEIQQSWKNISPLKLKIGIHIDKLIVEHGDIMGKGIKIASNIKNRSKQGSICISQSVSTQIADRPDIHTESMGCQTIEGIDGDHELYSIFIPENFIPMEDAANTEIPVQDINTNKTNYTSILMWIGGIALVSVISLQSALYFSKSTDENMINSIAVFPFEMIKGDVGDEWLKDHFSESLTFQLGSMKNIKIIDRLQIRKALNKYEMPKQAGIAELATEIGKDIGAKLVLLGNYSIIDNEILIITKIVNSKTGETTPLIKKQYNLDSPSAAFDIANDLSEKIFNHLQKNKVKNSR